MAGPVRPAGPQTFIPEHANHTEFLGLADLIRHSRVAAGASGATLQTAAGHLRLTPEIIGVILAAAEAMARGLAVTVAPVHTILTTQQAADLLGVSRPTLVGLLNEGRIPYEKPGRHRRIRLTDLLDYHRRLRDQQATVLDEMVEHAESTGLYDLEQADVQEALQRARQRRVPAPRSTPRMGG